MWKIQYVGHWEGKVLYLESVFVFISLHEQDSMWESFKFCIVLHIYLLTAVYTYIYIFCFNFISFHCFACLVTNATQREERVIQGTCCCTLGQKHTVMWYLLSTIHNLEPTAVHNSSSVPVEIKGCVGVQCKQCTVIEFLIAEKFLPSTPNAISRQCMGINMM